MILWDVGGPIDTEVDHEACIDNDIRVACATEGVSVDDTTYAEACRHAVETFAPDAYKSIIWRLCHGDVALSERVYAHMIQRANQRNLFEVRPGISELLTDLHARGVRLGLVANQPARTVQTLKECGIGDIFKVQAISGSYGFRKPDIRLFLAACDSLEVEPRDCIMIGDRIDNDIVPARSIGMQSILFRHGRHRDQQPRSWDEVPDVTVTTVDELALAIDRLLNQPS